MIFGGRDVPWNVSTRILNVCKIIFIPKISNAIYLIIEVADSSLKLDTEIKAKAYSQAGIKDYWVLDVVKRELIVFRNPTSEGYQNQEIITEHQNISPLDFPDLEILVSQMLPLI